MPKVKLGRKAQYNERTKQYEDVLFGRIASRRLTHEMISKHLGKSRSAVSYSLKDINKMKFEEIRILCDLLDVELILKRKE